MYKAKGGQGERRFGIEFACLGQPATVTSSTIYFLGFSNTDKNMLFHKMGKKAEQ